MPLPFYVGLGKVAINGSHVAREREKEDVKLSGKQCLRGVPLQQFTPL